MISIIYLKKALSLDYLLKEVHLNINYMIGDFYN